MTNERVCANDEARPVEPVTDWENESVNGMALSSESIFEEGIAKAQNLRARQATYLDSLPSDPPEVIRAALKRMHPNGDEYPDGIEEALHLSFALEALVKGGDLDAEGRTRDAALYVAQRVARAMHRGTCQLDRIADILGNPGRIERDRQAA